MRVFTRRLCFILCNKYDMDDHSGGVCQGPVRRGLTLRLLLLVLSMCHS